MSLLPFTQKANDALVAARERAIQGQHPELLPQHLFLALLAPEVGLQSRAGAGGAGAEAQQGLVDGAEELVDRLPKAIGGAEPQVGPAFRNFLELASDTGRGLGDRFLSTDAMLLAFANAHTDVKKLLERFGLDRKKLEAAIRETRKGARVEDERAEEKFASLEKYAKDFTALAGAGQAGPGHRPGRGDPPGAAGAFPAHQEQSGAHRRGRRGQDRHRRGAGPAHHQARRAREPQGHPAHGPGHGRPGGRHPVPGPVRGAPQGRHPGDRGQRGPDHPLHRRAAPAGGRGLGRGQHGRRQPAEAGPGPGRPALHRRHHPERVPEARGEGRGPGAALPAGLRGGAQRGGLHQHPARAEGALRAAPRRAHPGRGPGGGRAARQPLHRRPLPARQGRGPHGRGRLQRAHADRQPAHGDRCARAPGDAAAAGAARPGQGEGRRQQGARQGAGQGTGGTERGTGPPARPVGEREEGDRGRPGPCRSTWTICASSWSRPRPGASTSGPRAWNMARSRPWRSRSRPARQGRDAMLRLEVAEEDVAAVVSKWTGIPVAKLMEGEIQKLLHMEERLRSAWWARMRPGGHQPTPCGATGPGSPTPSGPSAASCSWGPRAWARRRWRAPWRSSSSTTRTPWSAST